MNLLSTGEIVSTLARQAVKEPDDALKIIVTDNGSISGMVHNLLVKVHGIPKNDIQEIGPTLSDDQINQLLRQGKHFIIISKNIINYRNCVFAAPESRKVYAISFFDNEIDSMPIHCEGDTMQFKPGYQLSLEEKAEYNN